MDSGIQVEVEDSVLSVTIEAKNGSTSSSVLDEARCKTSLFDGIVRELPYDAKTEIIIFDENLKDPKLSSNMVSLIVTPQIKWKVVTCLQIEKFIFAFF